MSRPVPRFVVVGDLTLDVTVAPSSPPRPAGDVPAMVRIGPGGQGANVAVRLARRGCPTILLASVGSDATGSMLRAAMADEGVELVGADAPRSGVVVVVLDAAGERSMLSDRRTLETEPLARLLTDAAWAHCSGYALLDDEGGDRLAALLGARGGGVRLSVAGGSMPSERDRLDRFRARLATASADVVIFSRSEATEMGAGGMAADLARALAGTAPVVVVTAGADGSAAVVAGEALEVPPASEPGSVVDATGAGDAYAASLVATLADGAWPPAIATVRRAMEAGARLGAQVARVMGAQARVDLEAGG